MNNQISVRQLCAAGFTGLLSLSAAAAGMDWRGALLAVPVVLLAMYAAFSGAKRTGGLLKNPGGKPLALLYIIWGVFLAGAVLALCGARMGEAGGQGGPLWPTVLAALPVLWLTAGRPEAFARTAEIFYLAMLAVLAFLVLLGAGQVEARWLLAPEGGLGRAFFTAAGLGCTGVYGALLWNGRGDGETGRVLSWTAAGGLVLAGMAALTVGSLGPALAETVERPFFLMTVGLGQTARVEALAALLWLVSDVTLLGLLLQSCRGMWRDVLALPGEKAAGVVMTGAALALALGLERLEFTEELLWGAIPAGGLLLGGAAPLLLWVMHRKETPAREDAPYFGVADSPEEAYLGEEKDGEKSS